VTCHPVNTIRNFSIIAHIDHGKSTLADRILEITGTITEREKQAQFLDDMELEKERGITIKARTVRIRYRARDGKDYILNLIDTPGHVDFTYEVSRSLAACEGALLVVDAVQGVEAQTIAHANQAIENNLDIVPVINKIDLPAADPERVKREIEEGIGIDSSHAILASAKEGRGIEDVLEGVVHRIPPPKGNPDGTLKALIFDSWFDPYMGAVVLIRIVDGAIRQGTKIMLMSSGKVFEVAQVGVFDPWKRQVDALRAGEVGYLMAGIKEVRDTRIGDTITEAEAPAANPLPGFRDVKPMVFSGLYPVDTARYEALRAAMDKLRLNDSSFTFEPETSAALGFGFRCGFLGLLHMEIVRERLEREFDLAIITTAATVVYRVVCTNGKVVLVDNPAHLPPLQEIDTMEEPIVNASIHAPEEYLGNMLRLCEERRGVQREVRFLGGKKTLIVYELPLNEIVSDFYDRLKSLSRGFASLDYEFSAYRPSDLVRLDLRINGEMVDALSSIVHRDKTYHKGRDLCEKLRELIPRQLYEVVIQAAIGNKVIARESVKPLRKNVTAKCYGGDITRKRKLLEKQKEGKKRMKQIGRVEIPQEAFLAVLKV
jgi:GTP-binding protein LepA